jgi:putative spermidine/putrescine transport system permease protein
MFGLPNLALIDAGLCFTELGIQTGSSETMRMYRRGMTNEQLLKAVGIHIDIYSKSSLELAYMYFQFPLMVLIIAPAIDGLRKDWREASENMGASSRQYWQYVALPILFPSILGCAVLLFGNAFGAQATAMS